MPKILQVTILLASIAALGTAAAPARAAGDAEAGKKAFRKCAICHDIRPGKKKMGPSLHGVFGREAARAPDYDRYSSALKKSGIVWNEETLDKYLQKPAKVVPGTRMLFPGVRSEKERADLIAYLKTLK